MRIASTLVALAIAASTTACVSNAPRVRDLDGNPLPPYALNDTASPVYKVRCPDGRGYLVITDLPAHLYSAQFGVTYRFVSAEMDGLCTRIQISKM